MNDPTTDAFRDLPYKDCIYRHLNMDNTPVELAPAI
jgi:hypothetical protein